MLLFAGCFGPRLALADASVARAEVTPTGAGPAGEASWPVEQQGAPLELRVSYRAPIECPSSADFLAALQRHVAAGGSGAIDADVNITRPNRAEFELVLRLRVKGKTSRSTTRAGSCLPLMQLAALDASMARTAGTEPRGTQRIAASALVLGPSPTLEASERLEPANSSEAGTEAAATGSRPSPSGGKTRAFVLADMRAASGLLPRLAWGRGISLGVARGSVSLRASGTLWQGQRGRFAPDDTSPLRLDFEQSSLQLSPCFGRSLSAGLRLDGCAQFAAHRVGTDAEAARAYASLGAAALLTLAPWRGLRVELEGGVSAAVRRPSFGADRVRYLYEPEVVQPSARISLGWELGGGT